MRICFITTALDVFKGGSHLPLLAAADGCTFTVMTTRVRAANDLPSNVQVEQVETPRFSYYYGRSDRAFANAVMDRYPAEHIFWKQFDVIHLNQTFGTRFLELSDAGLPVLYAVHHPVTADRNVALSETGCMRGLLWRARYASLVSSQRVLCNRIPTIMTVSHSMKERLHTDYGCPMDAVHVVPNGVNGDEFCPSNQEPAYDVVAIGSFLHPRKGFRYLVDVYGELAAKGVRIADVGRRSDAQRRMLSSIPEVTVLGVVEQEQLVTALQKSRVLVSTSLYEGFGLSLIEALACGKPAFAFGVGAVPEVLGSIDSSLIVPPRDTVEMAQRVMEFLKRSSAQQKEIGEKYRANVLEKYSMNKAADILQETYQKIVQR